MIPSVVSSQVRRGVEEFLLTTFPVTTPLFSQSLSELLNSDGSVFKGPYLSLKLPFLPGRLERRFFPEVAPKSFRPHLHQELAFQRLGDSSSRSTLLATGTGSGKTEAFLYPILDYCRRQLGRRGVKAIVIYPMNALASDQARRFARAIDAVEELRGKVTAGLYIGGDEGQSQSTMGPENVITNRDVLRDSPPDILLTNYKMLDYLLIRPRDAALWSENQPDTLKFLVVDELHTFDGAQGADLACLIRRLKARLRTSKGHLCCVGTSATLGDGPDGLNGSNLREYAEQLFGEPFAEDSVVSEAVETAEDFLKEHTLGRFAVPDAADSAVFDPVTYASQEDFLRAQHRLWFGEDFDPTDIASRLSLSDRLKGHSLFRSLLSSLAGKARPLGEVGDELAQQFNLPVDSRSRDIGLLLGSVLALVSVARTRTERGPIPLVQVRLQLWLREMSRLVAFVEIPSAGSSPRLSFADDLSPEEARRALPIVHCRECGVTGWAAVVKSGDLRLLTDLRSFYEHFFRFSPTVRFIYPEEDLKPGEQGAFGFSLCTGCLRLVPGAATAPCASCGAGAEQALAVRIPDSTYRDRENRIKGHHGCHACGGFNSLTIVGSRAASLTSVALSQLFASRFNDDKKLLAFSDSVQDASHRAGFFGARTYAFNFRTAIQKVIASQPAPVSLADLPVRFIAHWREALPDAQFVATFLPPDMAWLKDYEALREDGVIPAGSNLIELVERRIAWEIWSEYTFRSRIGRTLEKSGNSGATVRPGGLTPALESILVKLREEIGGLRELDAASLLQFLLGFITALKNRGGVASAELTQYIESGGNTWKLRRVYLPGFGKNTRAPSFLSNRSASRFSTIIRTNPNSPTWFEDWILRCLGRVDPGIGAYADAAWAIVLDGLVVGGVLSAWVGPHESRVWGIREDLFVVADAITQFRCVRCGTNVSVAADEAGSWDGMPCQRFRCSGTLDREPARDDYYRRLYATGDVSRVFAEEHTGLLSREERERIEEQFISGTGPGDPNLLSCTPTLEMGIDIGDLSSLALCSIPPKPSNYLQRIGRAGRVDGNAFILAVANGRPHDLFFYFEPEEMIQGLVEPPGCFLNASAVLERQFTGYVFDRWVETGVPMEAIPARLQVVLDTIERGSAQPDAFPNNLLTFFDLNRTSLEDGFFAMFADEVTEHSRTRIRSFVRGDDPKVLSLKVRLVGELQEVVAERKSLRNAIRRLTERITKLDGEPAGGEEQRDELDQLKQEKNALNRVVAELNKKQTLNFLTDGGLLPNYAFPESGVTLKSVIYRKNEKAVSGSKYESWFYEYERPAASAILELAPSNSFYAQGRKLLVDQVNIDMSKAEPWRFCADCSHMEIEGERELGGACPRCGHVLWPDDGQRRAMLRMKQVLSTENDRESRSHDESENREPEFFQRNMFVVTDERDIDAAYALAVDEIPFGFEFFRRLTLREVNLGRTETGQATLQIAGQQYEETGFVVCKACGKVKGVRKGWSNGHEVTIDHALHCRFRPTPGAVAPADVNTAFSAYFLYREFDSEGIRMLLPVATFDVDLKIESFVAALDLGLKKRFRGDPGHLLTTVYSDPVKGSAIRKRFLVLYDGVPGGTGYLKELMRDETALLDVLQLALDVLERCSCQHNPGKDGCYRCLLAYRGRHDKLKTSRRAALEILTPILRQRDKVRAIDRISAIPLGSLLESELELRFLEAIRRTSIGEKPVQLLPHVVHGKTGWYLKSSRGNWMVEPQVELGPDQRVDVSSRADFVLYPEDQGSGLPIAVFTDGFEFHADPESPHQRLGLDTAQRLALIRSGRFRVWSLTWDDVIQKLEPNGTTFESLGTATAFRFRTIAEHVDPNASPGWVRLRGASSFDLLTGYLETGATQSWQTFASCWLLSLLEEGKHVAEADRARLRGAFLSSGEVGLPDGLFETASTDLQTGRIEERLLGTSPAIQGVVYGETAKIRSGDVNAVAVTLRLNEEAGKKDPKGFKAAWRRFLWATNLVQFAPRAEFLTSAGLQSVAYGSLLDELFSLSAVKPSTSAEPLGALLSLSDVAVHALLHAVAGAGVPFPESGYEMVEKSGEIVAVAELGWEQQRLAVLLDREEEYRRSFEASGWKVFAASDSPEMIMDWLREHQGDGK